MDGSNDSMTEISVIILKVQEDSDYIKILLGGVSGTL